MLLRDEELYPKIGDVIEPPYKQCIGGVTVGWPTESQYKFLHWAIIVDTKPCAYIKVPTGHPWHGVKDFDELTGLDDSRIDITFAGEIKGLGANIKDDVRDVAKTYDGFYVGWDYGHLEDCTPTTDKKNVVFKIGPGKRHTVQEILEDIRYVGYLMSQVQFAKQV